jgi:hypothetical protein
LFPIWSRDDVPASLFGSYFFWPNKPDEIWMSMKMKDRKETAAGDDDEEDQSTRCNTYFLFQMTIKPPLAGSI